MSISGEQGERVPVPTALVVTVVHHPDDARIRHRQIDALLERGWRVIYAAPWADYDVARTVAVPGLEPVELPRSQGRHRLAAMRAARALLRERGAEADVVLLHDPELVLATVGLGLGNLVLDVHEDTSAAVQVRPWIPDALRPVAAAGVRVSERYAERRMALLLAEQAYAERFVRPHPVVLNTTRVDVDPVAPGVHPAEDGRQRAVYLGALTMERGAAELVEIGRRLTERGGPVVEIIGPAHGPARALVERAAKDGILLWRGFVPSDRALIMLDGALAGLSLLHDAANFVHSMPTKVIEYLGHALPVITTPLPLPAALVERSGAGAVVPFRDVDAVVEILMRWDRDLELARETGAAGHAVARADYDWNRGSQHFVEVMEELAGQGRRTDTP